MESRDGTRRRTTSHCWTHVSNLARHLWPWSEGNPVFEIKRAAQSSLLSYCALSRFTTLNSTLLISRRYKTRRFCCLGSLIWLATTWTRRSSSRSCWWSLFLLFLSIISKLVYLGPWEKECPPRMPWSFLWNFFMKSNSVALKDKEFLLQGLWPSWLSMTALSSSEIINNNASLWGLEDTRLQFCELSWSVMVHLPVRVDWFVNLRCCNGLLAFSRRRLMGAIGSWLGYEWRRNIESPWSLHIVCDWLGYCFLNICGYSLGSGIIVSPGRDIIVMISLFPFQASILAESAQWPTSHSISSSKFFLINELRSFSPEFLRWLRLASFLIFLDNFDLGSLNVDVIDVVVIDDICNTLGSLLACCWSIQLIHGVIHFPFLSGSDSFLFFHEVIGEFARFFELRGCSLFRVSSSYFNIIDHFCFFASGRLWA